MVSFWATRSNRREPAPATLSCRPHFRIRRQKADCRANRVRQCLPHASNLGSTMLALCFAVETAARGVSPTSKTFEYTQGPRCGFVVTQDHERTTRPACCVRLDRQRPAARPTSRLRGGGFSHAGRPSPGKPAHGACSHRAHVRSSMVICRSIATTVTTVKQRDFAGSADRHG